jgi:hypothetical protein
MKNVMDVLTAMSTCILFNSCQKSELTDPQNYLNEENSKKSSSAINRKNLSIGDYYQGGIIFYIDETGKHGLIVSTSDLGAAPWGCPGRFGRRHGVGIGQRIIKYENYPQEL